jgi:hypothetical protein
MNFQYLKIAAVALALFFLSSCAVVVRDDDHPHRHYWRWHSSLQQSNQSIDQMTAQNIGDPGGP